MKFRSVIDYVVCAWVLVCAFVIGTDVPWAGVLMAALAGTCLGAMLMNRLTQEALAIAQDVLDMTRDDAGERKDTNA